MAQIIRDPSIAASLGQATGSALGQTLTNLAERRIQDQHKKQLLQEKAEAFRGLGLDPSEANYVAGLDPQFAKLYLENKGFGIPDYKPQINPSMPEQLQPNLPSYGQGLQERLGSPQQGLQQPTAEFLNPGSIPRQGLPQFNPTSQMPQEQRQTQLEDYLKDPRLTPSQRANLALKLEQMKQKQGAASINGQPVMNDKERALQERKQRRIDISNKPFLTKLDTALESAERIKELTNEMQQLLNTGNVTSGFYGRYAPIQFLNDESQAFDAKSKELAALLGSTKGTASNFKIQLAQDYKPNLGQSTSTQQKLLTDALKLADRIIKTGDIRDSVIEDNNGVQPENLSGKVLKELHGKSSRYREGDTLSKLPSYDEAVKMGLQVGGRIEDTEANTIYEFTGDKKKPFREAK